MKKSHLNIWLLATALTINTSACHYEEQGKITPNYLAFLGKKDKTKKYNKKKQDRLEDPKIHILCAVQNDDFVFTEVETQYKDNIVSEIINFDGEKIESDILPEQIKLSEEYYKNNQEVRLPLYKYLNPINKDEVLSYIIPMYGRGFWGDIYGYLALNSDLKTIKGISFDYNREKWGKIIGRKEFLNKFINKPIMDKEGFLVPTRIHMFRFQQPEENDNTVNVMIMGKSTPTTTYRGVDEMLSTYLKLYMNYIKKHNSKVL